jgi:hypothetical protein
MSGLVDGLRTRQALPEGGCKERAMHLDTDAYIAVGFLVATVVTTLGLFGFLFNRMKKR